MPISGTLDVAPLLADAPLMPGLEAEAWQLDGVDILHLMFEIDDGNMAELLPKALHPVIPPVAIFSVARVPESPVGPFLLAQVRVGCRAGVRPRGYLLRAYSDSQEACDALAERWGYACRLGEVRLRRYHDRISAEVTAGGEEILRVSMANHEPISGADVQYVANMNLARLANEEDRGVLVQVDPEYAFHRAERGPPKIDLFVPEAWAAVGVEPVYPVSGSFCHVDTGLPRIRYILDPERPALQGTRKIG